MATTQTTPQVRLTKEERDQVAMFVAGFFEDTGNIMGATDAIAEIIERRKTRLAARGYEGER